MASPIRTLRSARRGAAAAAAVALALSAPGATRAQGGGVRGAPAAAARTLALYPVTGRGELDGDAADVQSLLDAALRRVDQRSEDVVVAEPLLVRASCGPSQSATPECLAPLAAAGMLVRATVHRAGNALLVALYAVDAAGRSHGPVSAAIDAYVQSAEPLANAVLLLVDRVVIADRRGGIEPRSPSRPSLAAAGQGRPARPAETSPAPATPSPPRPVEADAVVPAEKPDLAAPEPAHGPAPVAAATAREGASAGGWIRPTGRWLTGAGVALLAGGLALSTVNRSLSQDLDRKHAAGTLTAGDLPSYRRVERANTLTAVLLASGGAFTLAGVALWTAPPGQGRVVAGVAGRF